MGVINVICARWGKGFERYAERLESMVARHLTLPHKFHCYADEELFEYAPPRFWQYPSSHRPRLYSGYPLLFAFNPKLPIEGRTLFLGLDVLIVDNINDMVQIEAPFIAIKDWHQGNWNNSVMLYTAGKYPHVFDDFPPDDAENKTEQDWLTEKFRLGLAWPEHWVRSYKTHCQAGIPDGCKVVVFHGEPKNHQVSDEWVKEHWR